MKRYLHFAYFIIPILVLFAVLFFMPVFVDAQGKSLPPCKEGADKKSGKKPPPKSKSASKIPIIRTDPNNASCEPKKDKEFYDSSKPFGYKCIMDGKPIENIYKKDCTYKKDKIEVKAHCVSAGNCKGTPNKGEKPPGSKDSKDEKPVDLKLKNPKKDPKIDHYGKKYEEEVKAKNEEDSKINKDLKKITDARAAETAKQEKAQDIADKALAKQNFKPVLTPRTPREASIDRERGLERELDKARRDLHQREIKLDSNPTYPNKLAVAVARENKSYLDSQLNAAQKATYALRPSTFPPPTPSAYSPPTTIMEKLRHFRQCFFTEDALKAAYHCN